MLSHLCTPDAADNGLCAHPATNSGTEHDPAPNRPRLRRGGYILMLAGYYSPVQQWQWLLQNGGSQSVGLRSWQCQSVQCCQYDVVCFDYVRRLFRAEGADVERQRTQKVMKRTHGFNIDRPVLAIRFHRLQANESTSQRVNESTDQMWLFDETVETYTAEGISADLFPVNVVTPPSSTEMKKGSHWEIY